MKRLIIYLFVGFTMFAMTSCFGNANKQNVLEETEEIIEEVDDTVAENDSVVGLDEAILEDDSLQ